MPATLKSVQWLTIQEVADLWQPHLERPKGAIIRELRFGWYKWSNEKVGVEGFRCGDPLKAIPHESELPALDDLVDREFLEQFSIKQGWKMPDDWNIGPKSGADRYPGRPSVKRAIVQKLNELAGKQELRESVSQQASVLHEWADKEFRTEQVPTKKTIENHIRVPFRELRRRPD